MKKINLPLVMDTFFAGTCAFLLFFTAVRYYTKSVAAALVFGIAAMLLFGALGYLYISRKQNKKLIVTRDEKEKKLLSLHLSLSSDAYIKNLLRSMLGENARISGKKIIWDGTAHFFDFKMQPLSEDDVAQVIKYGYNGKKKIFCTAVSPQAAALAGNFSIETAAIDEVYENLKKKQLLPEKYVYEEPPKQKLHQRIKARFSRKLALPLFWSGAGLLALSYVAFFPLYYVISGSLVLALAAVSFVFGQR